MAGLPDPEAELEPGERAEKRESSVEKLAEDLALLGSAKAMKAVQRAMNQFGAEAIEKTVSTVSDEFVQAAIRGYLQFFRDWIPSADAERELLVEPLSRFEDQQLLLSPKNPDSVFSDVSFTFGDKPGAEVHAHKILLSCYSDTFRRMFASSFRERTAKLIPIADVSHDSFTLVLKFIYANGNVAVLQELISRKVSSLEEQLDAALSLLEASHLYELTALHKQCESLILSFVPNVDVNDIYPIYRIAEACRADRLLYLCRQYMLRYFDRLQPEAIEDSNLKDELAAAQATYSSHYIKLTVFIFTDPSLPPNSTQDLLEKLMSAHYNEEQTLKRPKKLRRFPKYTKYIELQDQQVYQIDLVVLPSDFDLARLHDLMDDVSPPETIYDPAGFLLLYDVALSEWLLKLKASIKDHVTLSRAPPTNTWPCITNALLVADTVNDATGAAAMQLYVLPLPLLSNLS